ncbi:ultraviolet-B receptor UVR8-like [Chenopodium quinoa]|uniref:ultraviolet-B receptor UVR8-like n=1 Tax=Chenopodium quinoa TaxID=63459 RepID=UPI000B798351|nr:ultraviolet-B receptor UVR8-like [Chenopodium quinoa]
MAHNLKLNEMMQFLWKRSVAPAFVSRCRSFSSGVTGNGSSLFSVMSFGDGSQGALGLPSSLIGVGADAYEPTVVPGLPADVVSVSAGHYHSLAVTAKGELWAWGRNDEGQLGRGLLEPRCSWNEPKLVKELDNVKVQSAFASGVISAAIGDDGSIWTWGRSKRGQLGHGKGITESLVPSKVKALTGEHITKVSLGWGHVLAQTIDGKLFGWGYSADGRLGRLGETVKASPLDSSAELPGRHEMTSSEALDVAEKLVLESMEKEKDMPIVWEPHLIEELHSISVTDISCGLDHSLLICRDNTILSGGSNIYGQLGRENQGLRFFPVDISFRPLSVACGLGHSLAICEIPASEDGNDFRKAVYSWGWNGSSQLGRPGHESKPLAVESLAEEIPTAVSCGRVHSLAVTGNGQLWVWGCGKNGRLGLGSSFDESEPALVDIEQYKVVQAVAGFDHTLLLVAES